MENSILSDILNCGVRLVDLIRWPVTIVMSLNLVLKILKGR